MFNKKIVSLISALAMALSMCSFVSVQAADVPAADLEFKVEKNIFDQETFDDGYQEYTITVSLKTENIGLENNGKSGAQKKYKGSRVTSFAGKILFDNTVFYTDNEMMEIKVPGGNPFIAPHAEGVTFNWYCGDYATGLEDDTVELFKINLYGQNEDGDVTIGPDADFESMFAWDTTSRSVSYCEWPEFVKTAELSISSPKVLGDNKSESGWVGDLGIAAGGEEVTEIEPTKYNLLSNGGYAWDVVIEDYDSTKTYATIFTDGEETRTVGDNVLTFPAETEGDIAFAILMKTARENVELKISIQ